MASVLAGCASGPMPEDQKVLEVRSIRAYTSTAPSFHLTKEIRFVVPGGQGIMGDMAYAALAGDYVLHGVDSRGTYYRHSKRGIKRSGDFARIGGVFVPHDRQQRWGLWIVPNGVDVNIGLFGPAGAAMGAPDPSTSVVYEANIPVDLLPPVQQEIEAQLTFTAPTGALPPK